VQQTEVLHQKETDAAAAHEADERGHAHVDVPPVDGERDKQLESLTGMAREQTMQFMSTVT
jgi:hypothetical protein